MSSASTSTADQNERAAIAARRPVTAVLGPTNTGKTHLAIERMLGHQSGMIGLPLRLLAREVYDRVVRAKGAREVALITGEEKIAPPTARYFICTVEAMPQDREVDFVAIDEIQLAADRERGHTFTDRLLRCRGRHETMLMGSDTARHLIGRLLPRTRFINRPRFSELSWTGSKKLTRLPRRSAIVAFSADQVYAIAELIRRQRGGAAVVMGALSPRTRNAQVALYQSGDVDFLVATDAIGMGLNMDVDHVAFASTAKFDGRQHRPLRVVELAQIAGRAGRYMNDGTFGVTADAVPLADDMIERIENHQFDADQVFQWRNPDLDFASMDALIRSLEVPPRQHGLTRGPVADDLEALTRMSRDHEVRDAAAGPHAIRKLWEVVQLPDFRKTMASEHATLLSSIYLFLMQPEGRIPDDWFSTQLGRLDRTDGDIDTLAARLAHMRTWSYVSNRSDWLHDPVHWQERARTIEDKLSDALHERLTQRFIDRRTSVLMKRLRQKEDLMAAVNSDGEVLVEGEFVGRLQGFVFVPDPRAEGVHGKALRAASDAALALEINARAARLTAAPDADIHLSEHGRIIWEGQPVASLHAADDPLLPRVELIAGDELTGPPKENLQTRLQAWTRMHVNQVLAPLTGMRDAEDVEGLARGVAYRLVENFGSLRREAVSEDIRALDQNARGQLRKHGVRFGAYTIFMPALLKPAPARLLLTLWALARKGVEDPFADLPAPPTPGLTSVPADKTAPDGFYDVLGFRVCGERAVRVDMLERLADLIRPVIAERRYNGGFVVNPDMMSLVGCSGEEFASLLRGLGYRSQMEKVKLPKEEVVAAQPASGEQTETASGTQPDTASENADATANDAPAADTPPETKPETLEAPTEAAATPEAPVAPTEAAPTETDAPEAPTVDTSEAPATETSPEAAPASDAAPAETPAGEAPQAAPASETGAGTEPEAEAANAESGETETVELEIWRPQRRHQGGKPQRQARRDDDQPRRRRPKGGDKKGGAETRSGKPPRKDGGPKKPRNNRSHGKPEREKAPDPDSPFAALAVLKDRQKQN